MLQCNATLRRFGGHLYKAVLSGSRIKGVEELKATRPPAPCQSRYPSLRCAGNPYDPLGDVSKTCKVLEGSLIYQTKPIRKNQGLFISYGSAFDVKVRYMADSLYATILEDNTASVHSYATYPYTSNRGPIWLLGDTGLTRLIIDFLCHDEALNGLNEFRLGFYPAKILGDRTYLELLLRSKQAVYPDSASPQWQRTYLSILLLRGFLRTVTTLRSQDGADDINQEDQPLDPTTLPFLYILLSLIK